MPDIDYESYFNPGSYCVLPGHTRQYCQERYCKGCGIYRAWKDRPSPRQVAVVGDPTLPAILGVVQIMTMAQRGKSSIQSKETRWNTMVKDYPLLTVPNPKLSQRCRPVENIDEAKKIIEHLLLAMNRQFGDNTPAGFAANQFGFDLRVIVFRRDTETIICLVNPVIVKSSPSTSAAWEGCLSIPNNSFRVSRPKWVKVKGTLPDGSQWSVKAHDSLARVLCHEIDHLDGILIDTLDTKEG